MLKFSDRRHHLRQIFAVLALSGLSGRVWAQFSQGDALSGVKTALERGADAAVSLLGQNGGFLDNPKVHIPLPGVLNDAAYAREVALVRETLSASKEPHWQEYLAAWVA